METTEYAEKAKMEERVAFEIEQNAFRGLVKMLARLGSEMILFSASDRALRLFAVNEDHAMLVMGYINRESFRKYEISNEHAFAIDVKDLNSVLALSDKKSMVHFSKIGEKIHMESDDGFSQEFTISLEGTTIRVPGIQYEHGVLVSLKGLTETATYADDVGSDIIKLLKDRNVLAVTFNRGKTLLEKNLEIEREKDTKLIADGVFGTYSPEYLKSALKGMYQLCGDVPVMVRMNMDGKEMAPLKISFRADINADNNKAIRGYALIAPRTPN
ncbi:MAG: hypothetical protein QXU18_00365 [Thermoplasmatales archaeon]